MFVSIGEYPNLLLRLHHQSSPYWCPDNPMGADTHLHFLRVQIDLGQTVDKLRQVPVVLGDGSKMCSLACVESNLCIYLYT